MKRFLAVLNIPSPYRLHLLKELSRQLKGREIEFLCFFMAKGHRSRPENWLNPDIPFPHRYFMDIGCGCHHFNPGLILNIMMNKYDWILFGSPFDTFTGLCISLLARAKCKVAWIEGNTANPGKLHGIYGWLKRLVLSRCTFIAVPGQEGVAYVQLHRKLTVRKLPDCVYLPNLVDETKFKRGDGSVGEDRVCLIPSRLSPEKGVLPFVRLLDKVMLNGWRLVVLGKGTEENEILKTAESGGFLDKILILNYVKYDDMPRYYAESDLMLLPSLRDQNPLVVIEALHCGLPIALSDRAGNVAEAVSDGVNGWVLPVSDKEAFRRKLKEVFATPKHKLKAMGAFSKLEKSKFWDSRVSISKFLDSIS